jgi:hypothetical protein
LTDTFAFNGQDETFQIRVESASLPSDVLVAVWLGEPYGVMHGFRIVVDRRLLAGFADAFEREAADVEGGRA